MRFELFSSAFCGPCHHARAVLDEATRLIPGSRLVEHDVVCEAALAERCDIRSTPTVIVRDAAGRQAFRASGVPTLAQALAAAARAVDAASGGPSS